MMKKPSRGVLAMVASVLLAASASAQIVADPHAPGGQRATVLAAPNGVPVVNVQPILQGSAVTGASYATGQAFDVGRLSDFDIALASPTLLQRARELGIELRSSGTRTGPLTDENLRALGLKTMSDQLSLQSGREVNFMIYDQPESALSRAPGVVLPTKR